MKNRTEARLALLDLGGSNFAHDFYNGPLTIAEGTLDRELEERIEQQREEGERAARSLLISSEDFEAILQRARDVAEPPTGGVPKMSVTDNEVVQATERNDEDARASALSPDYARWLRAPAVSIVDMVLLSLEIEPSYKAAKSTQTLSARFSEALALSDNGYKPFSRRREAELIALLGEDLLCEVLERHDLCKVWACVRDLGHLVTYVDDRLSAVGDHGLYGNRFVDTFVRPREFAEFCFKQAFEIPGELQELVPPLDRQRIVEQNRQEAERRAEPDSLDSGERRVDKGVQSAAMTRKLRTYQQMLVAMACELGWNPSSDKQQLTGAKARDGLPAILNRLFGDNAVKDDIVRMRIREAYEAVRDEMTRPPGEQGALPARPTVPRS